MLIGNKVDTVGGNMVAVRVAPRKRLSMHVSGHLMVYQGALPGAGPATGDTVMVPAFEVQYLRRDGMVI